MSDNYGYTMPATPGGSNRGYGTPGQGHPGQGQGQGYGAQGYPPQGQGYGYQSQGWGNATQGYQQQGYASQGQGYRLTYGVDIVFCIDCTESMDNVIDIVKSRALSFYTDVQAVMAQKNKQIDSLRVRVVAFRDYLAYEEERRRHTHTNEPMLVTDFFTLPAEAHKLEASVKSLHPAGGGDDPEDGLEALAYSIRSDWALTSFRNRHIIVLWTDQEPHQLGFGAASSRYPRGMASSLAKLTEWWGDAMMPGYMPEQSAKRLILFAPNAGAWSYISSNWDNVLHLPSRAGDHLQDIDYQKILGSIAQTIA